LAALLGCGGACLLFAAATASAVPNAITVEATSQNGARPRLGVNPR